MAEPRSHACMWLWGRENCLVPSFLRITCSGGLLQTGRGYLQTSQRDNGSPPGPLCVPRALGVKVRLESCAADMCLMAVIPLPGWPFVHFRAQPLHPSLLYKALSKATKEDRPSPCRRQPPPSPGWLEVGWGERRFGKHDTSPRISDQGDLVRVQGSPECASTALAPGVW